MSLHAIWDLVSYKEQTRLFSYFKKSSVLPPCKYMPALYPLLKASSFVKLDQLPQEVSASKKYVAKIANKSLTVRFIEK